MRDTTACSRSKAESIDGLIDELIWHLRSLKPMPKDERFIMHARRFAKRADALLRMSVGLQRSGSTST